MKAVAFGEARGEGFAAGTRRGGLVLAPESLQRGGFAPQCFHELGVDRFGGLAQRSRALVVLERRRSVTAGEVDVAELQQHDRERRIGGPEFRGADPERAA